MGLSTVAIKDGNGNAQTFLANNYTGSNLQSAVIISDGTNVGPTMDAAARAGFQKITDGTNTMPTMDAVGRKGFVSVTDGTNTMPTGDAVARAVFFQVTDATTGPVAVKASSTAVTAADKALVVGLSPNTAVVTNADCAATAGTVSSKALLKALQYLGFASLPACTSAQTVAAQCDTAGNQKVAVVPAGTPVFLGTTSSATTTGAVTLTIPAGKMGYLSGFDIDGLGATAGAIAALTITGLIGTTMTFDIGIPAGATVPVQISKRFNPPLQGTTTGVNIVLNQAAFGAGNTGWSLNAQGSYI